MDFHWAMALHVISIIAWMAGLLYLPRLFVYHTEAEIGSKQSETFKIMERRLYRAISTPAMISSWFFGLLLVFYYQVIDWSWPWVWIKGVSVILLTVVHFMQGADVKRFAGDENTRPQRYFRIANEVPTILMIIIVIMVIVQPF